VQYIKNAKEQDPVKAAHMAEVYKGIAKDWQELQHSTPDTGMYEALLFPVLVVAIGSDLFSLQRS